MLNEIIFQKAKSWIDSPDCKVKEVISYIRARGFLREPQVEAIEVYLFLKLKGENKPLWQLLVEGFFSHGLDLANLQLTEDARQKLSDSVAARSIYEFVRKQAGNTTRTPSKEENLVANSIDTFDFAGAAKEVFYGVEYADYLLSLPMGAGKTFLMAAIMYLDLYFAQTEPENRLFAHNFLVLVPSGLKSSIVPSLKTIERFDPSWVIPEPAASNLKRQIKFEVLDEAKSATKSNKAKNPNVQKIARHQPFDDLMGLVMVVNAEKVILDRLKIDKQGHLFLEGETEKDELANELRSFIGKIPNLQIHIDEVHHATDSDIKLRQVVNGWNETGNTNSVLGYSGTPYLEKREKIVLDDKITLQSEQITNTIYYYPLIDAVRTFLKTPQIKFEEQGLNSLQIVEKGVKEFCEKYGKTRYEDGTMAKLAIYCGLIDRLEDEVFPFLTGEMGIDPESILRFHIGNKKHPTPPDAALEFKMLDDPSSKKQIVLLAQIGKEGWDCRSLTGVILSQSGDCPKNMVLQTSCRCLRQVGNDTEQTALVWLSHDNAKTLNDELGKKQKTSIAELNSAGKVKVGDSLERYSRIDHLKLPKVEFYQLNVEYETVVTESDADPAAKIAAIDAKDFHNAAIIATRNLADGEGVTTSVVSQWKGAAANFDRWRFSIFRDGFQAVSLDELRPFTDQLREIFESVTVETDGQRFFNDLHDIAAINSHIRLAFHSHRDLLTREEIIPASAQMLLVEKLSEIAKPRNYLPIEKDVDEILALDAKGVSVEEEIAKRRSDYDKAVELLRSQGLENMLPNVPNGYSMPVTNKDRTFHYLPYKFDSGFEKDFLETILGLQSVRDRNLEVYFNGDRDVTDFRIVCYSGEAKDRKRIGLYTPDFLIIERQDDKIFRVLILETKGSGFADQKAFILRRKFVETEFLKLNNEKFDYKKFDYLYLTDADDANENLVKLSNKIDQFFAA